MKSKKTSKAKKHEEKGDNLIIKKKIASALKEYQKALEIDPNLEGIYDKLIAAKDMLGHEWNMEDFAESVSWVMKKQEKDNPLIKQIHARLTPEWKKATKLAMNILAAEDENETGKLIEELVLMGDIATRALVGILLDFKKAMGPKSKEGE